MYVHEEDKEYQEMEKRKMNIVVRGIPEENTEQVLTLNTGITDVISNKFGMKDIVVYGAHRVGKKNTETNRAIEELKKYTTSMVEQSQTLNTPGAEKKSKRDLFVSLKHELEGPVLERASKAAWELILSKEGIGKEIMETVYRAYNQLHGKETSLYSPSDPHTSVTTITHESQTQGQGVSHFGGLIHDSSHISLSAFRVEEQ
ncbi:hypothetical protein L7F22_002334 [Adiantum nelumboides]|nr:hypothetical protein [Adiantum nelumboides]